MSTRDDAAGHSLRSCMEAIRRACHADRVSLARLDDSEGTFMIAAESGRPLMNPGVGFPVELSTMIAQGADGEFESSNFTLDRRWVRPLDSLMLGMGFNSGVSLSVQVDDDLPAVLSVSSNALLDLDHAAERARRHLPRLIERARRAWTEAPVLLCDDVVFALPLRHLLEHEFGRAVIQVSSVEAALECVRRQPVRLVVLGPVVAPDAWVAACSRLRAVVGAPILLHSQADTMRARRAAHASAADGYLPQGASVPEATGVVSTLLSGGRSLPAVSGTARLAPREIELLRCLERGQSFQQASAHLGVTLTTAKSYGRSLYSKLEAGTKTSAIRRGRELGWL